MAVKRQQVIQHGLRVAMPIDQDQCRTRDSSRTRHGQTPQYGATTRSISKGHFNVSFTWSASRTASAMIDSVGVPLPEVGNTELPPM